MFKLSSEKLFTTWKARRKPNSEETVVVKRSIDYIFYLPFRPSTVKNNYNKNNSNNNNRKSVNNIEISNKSPVVAFSRLLLFLLLL